jgi:hypothetical protein
VKFKVCGSMASCLCLQSEVGANAALPPPPGVATVPLRTDSCPQPAAESPTARARRLKLSRGRSSDSEFDTARDSDATSSTGGNGSGSDSASSASVTRRPTKRRRKPERRPQVPHVVALRAPPRAAARAPSREAGRQHHPSTATASAMVTANLGAAVMLSGKAAPRALAPPMTRRRPPSAVTAVAAVELAVATADGNSDGPGITAVDDVPANGVASPDAPTALLHPVTEEGKQRHSSCRHSKAGHCTVRRDDSLQARLPALLRSQVEWRCLSPEPAHAAMEMSPTGRSNVCR